MRNQINRMRERVTWVAPALLLDIPIGFRIYQTIIFAIIVGGGIIVGLVGV